MWQKLDLLSLLPGVNIGWRVGSFISPGILPSCLQRFRFILSLILNRGLGYKYILVNRIQLYIWSTIICYKLTCYPLTCNQNQLRSHPFAIKSLICYQASTAIGTFAFKPHLLSGQFAINPQLQSTILLSIIICHQIMLILSNFFIKIRKKMEKFLRIWNS